MEIERDVENDSACAWMEITDFIPKWLRTYMQSIMLAKYWYFFAHTAINTFSTPSRETRLANPYVLYPKPWNTAR